MIQALSISNSTVVRATVISQRTNSDELGIIKAMMIEQLKEKLANGVAHFIYTKRPNKYGEVELREAWGTTQSNIASAMTNGRGFNKELVNCIAYFDVIKGNWRSFRFENIYMVF